MKLKFIKLDYKNSMNVNKLWNVNKFLIEVKWLGIKK